MNPLLLKWGSICLAVVGVVVLIGGTIAAIFQYGVRTGEAAVRLEIAKNDQKFREAQDRITSAVAEAISKIEIKHTTIRQLAEKEIIREERYRECVHTPAVYGLLNDALADREPRQSPGGSSVPGADGAAGRELRGNDAEAVRSDEAVPRVP